MSDLLADRFLAYGAAWMDVASGATVRVRLLPAGTPGERLAWGDRCAALARMRHPVLNRLIDYGIADARRRFEAYSVSPPIRARGGAGARLLAHAARFLEAHAVSMDGIAAGLALRQVEAVRGTHRRPLGVVLQPRRALAALREALADVHPGGVVALTIAGARGSGLRTLREEVARDARLQGFVPVSAALIDAPGVALDLRDRHVCVLLDLEAGVRACVAAATLAGRLGLHSPRRHVVIRFVRSPAVAAELTLDPLGVTAMISMVFTDPDSGPDGADVLHAARISAGSPGRFLRELHALPYPDFRPAYSVVHEVAPGYVVEPRPVPARPAGARPRLLDSAAERAARLAARGRHASAARLLSRATRVLEGRGDRQAASRCAEQLGWILRDRGRTDAALEQFGRSRVLAQGGAGEIRGTIATAVAWTDLCRLSDAEAALRSAVSAADVLGDDALAARACLALARCLYWDGRHDEARIPADRVASSGTPGTRVEALARSARIHLVRGDLRAAMAAASEAVATARTVGPRHVAVAARALAETQAALGDGRTALATVQEGLRAAAAAHAPLQSLRLRAIARRLPAPAQGQPGGHKSRALGERPVPPLVRRELDGMDAPPAPADSRYVSARMLGSLEELLELAHGAGDDASGVAAVVQALCVRLRAATVQVLSGQPDRRMLARTGRPWSGDLRLVERALASGSPDAIVSDERPREAVQCVRYAGRTLAVVVCRWTATAVVDAGEAAAILRTGALALAPAVSGLMDRPVHGGGESSRDLLGASEAAATLRDAIVRAARAPFPVLIEGESGSGKELVARAIHRLGARRERRLCTVNCAALSEELLESELFGHARGSFTGAVGERPGLFEEADGGTLFLDEVGELSPRAQAKLLRVLQEGEVRRVGENFPRRVDARVIAATNRRLDEEVKAGRFRGDLRFRLDVVRIAVPALRDRPADVPLLAAHFWEEASRRVDSRATLSPETLQALARYDWPGNVRQLQNVLASLAVHAPRRGRVPPSLLPAQIGHTARSAGATFETARAEFERRFVAAELARAGGRRSLAARSLGVTRQGLAKMMRRLGL